MILVLTALIGASGALPAASKFPARYVCITDRQGGAPGWETMDPRDDYTSPRRAARWAKMAVFDLFPDADWTIWLDASFDLQVDPAVIVAAAEATGCDVAGFAHPDRHRIRDEAREIVRAGLAPKELVDRQVDAYRMDGFDVETNPQTVLTTTGLLVRRNTLEVRRFTRRWRHEIEHWTVRDQLSVDYAAWKSGVRLGHLPGHYRQNEFATYNRERHRRGRVAA